ncbi:MAG: peptidylprolyl isomerase [Myxococcota bacterium]|nr:peptidylprolyl isomerase [Myxococcota bacterium]
MQRSRLTRALRWPPLHFAIGGALLFVVATVLGPEEVRDADPARVILVEDARVAALSARHETQTGLPADAATERFLVDRFVEEEILYREALRRGLATDNPAVIGRLREKLAFLGEDHGGSLDDASVLRQAAELGLADEDLVLRNMFVRNMRLLLGREGEREPTGEEIESFYRSHAAEFRRPARVSWRHVFLDRDERGPGLAEHARALHARLRSSPQLRNDPEKLGDPFAAGAEFRGKTPNHVVARFGEAFADAVLALPVGEWSEPIASPFGLHLVRVEERVEEHVAPLDQVRDRVVLAWRREIRRQHLDRSLAELRTRYVVILESESRWEGRS